MSRRSALLPALPIVPPARTWEVDTLLDAAVDPDTDSAMVERFYQNNTDKLIRLRAYRLDFLLTEPSLSPSPVEFDFGGLLGVLYLVFDDPVLPAVVWPGSAPLDGFMLEVPAGGMRHVGSFEAQVSAPIAYELDVLNPTAADMSAGAYLHHGFVQLPEDPLVKLWSGDGTLGGGHITLDFTPEVSSAALLLVGGFAAMHRRRLIGACARDRVPSRTLPRRLAVSP